MRPWEMPEKCPCCERKCDSWDSLYGVCSVCAFEHSLERWPCDHGAARRAEQQASHTEKK